jgi:hypothetical protein
MIMEEVIDNICTIRQLQKLYKNYWKWWLFKTAQLIVQLFNRWLKAQTKGETGKESQALQLYNWPGTTVPRDSISSPFSTELCSDGIKRLKSIYKDKTKIKVKEMFSN